MNKTKQILSAAVRLTTFSLGAFAAAGVAARADVVETVGGSVIQGKVLASDSGVIKVETDFAGTIEIKQAQVKSLVTDAPVFVELKDGNTVQGRVEKSGDGLRIAGTSGTLQTQPDAISAVWHQGEKSPADKAADALRRQWAYSLAFDLNGKQGNSDRLFVGLSARAELKGAEDRLIFYGNYARAEENSAVAQDEGKGGVDYSNYFTPLASWYVRTEIGYDHTKDLSLRSQSAVGLGRTFIKKPNQTFEGRLGVSYRFENYNPGTDFSSAGLDVGFLHSLTFSWGKMNNSLTYTPAFRNFSNYVITHESALELPTVWGDTLKIRLGIKNDYTSKPPPGLKRHDWSYLSQLVFTWR